jgi:hypothetical protein
VHFLPHRVACEDVLWVEESLLVWTASRALAAAATVSPGRILLDFLQPAPALDSCVRNCVFDIS